INSWLGSLSIDIAENLSVDSLSDRPLGPKLHGTQQMRLTSRSAVLLFILGSWAGSAFAINPALSLDQHVIPTWGVDPGLLQGARIRSFEVADGMPSEAVTTLYESGNGTIWIGTQKGLASRQADGHIVTIAGTESMAVTALAEDWSGQLWIGTTHGVVTFKD